MVMTIRKRADQKKLQRSKQKKIPKKFLLLFVCIIILLFASYYVLSSSNSSSKYADDFTFTLLNGKEVTFSDYLGKILILDFMGAHCQPCQIQMFVLREIADNYSSTVDILSLDVWVASAGENTQDIITLKDAFSCSSPCSAEEQYPYVQYLKSIFNKEEGFNLDWTFGLDDSDGTILTKFQLSGVPTLFLYDIKGNIYYSNVGYTDYDTLAAKIEELLR